MYGVFVHIGIVLSYTVRLFINHSVYIDDANGIRTPKGRRRTSTDRNCLSGSKSVGNRGRPDGLFSRLILCIVVIKLLCIGISLAVGNIGNVIVVAVFCPNHDYRRTNGDACLEHADTRRHVCGAGTEMK